MEYEGYHLLSVVVGDGIGRGLELTFIADVGSDPSFCVFSILQEGPTNGKAAVQSDVTDWTQQYHQNFVVGMGTASSTMRPSASEPNRAIEPSDSTARARITL